MSAPDPARRSGRRQFLLVASLFVVPLLAAVLLYYSSDWRPAVNSQGTLIDPPVALTAAGLELVDGRPAPTDVFEGKWSLLHPTVACDERTAVVMDELRRVRLALDKDAPRVQRVLLHGGGCAHARFPAGDGDLLMLASAEGEEVIARFPAAVDGAPGIYIVDPHGNLMMSYPASGSGRGLLKDLERLLRVSNIG